MPVYNPSTFAPERLYQGQPSTRESTLYTAPSTCQRVIIKEIIITNTSSSNATVSLSIVPSGQTAGVANRILASATLAAAGQPNSSLKLDQMSQVMYANDFISGLQGTSGAITVTISGVVIS